MKNVNFLRRLADGSTYRLGTAVYYPNGPGWRFLSNVSSHKSSRKFHVTMEKCVPRWVGYPDKCESEEVQPATTWPHVESMASWREWAKAGRDD